MLDGEVTGGFVNWHHQSKGSSQFEGCVLMAIVQLAPSVGGGFSSHAKQLRNDAAVSCPTEKN